MERPIEGIKPDSSGAGDEVAPLDRLLLDKGIGDARLDAVANSLGSYDEAYYRLLGITKKQRDAMESGEVPDDKGETQEEAILPDGDVSNVKTAYSPTNVNLGERAVRLIVASEAVAQLGKGSTSEEKKKARDIVEKEVDLASGKKEMLDSGEDRLEEDFYSLMYANELIKRYSGKDNQEAREAFIKTQRSLIK
jgi:hypothetical protein